MTANGTTHTIEEANVDVSNLDMFVQVQLLTEPPVSPSPGNLFNCAKKTVTRMNGIQVSHHVSSRMGETSSVKPTTTFTL